MAKKAKKQRKKLDFSKAKKVMTNILKMCGRVSIVTLEIASLGAFLVIPFLHNYIDHTWAQWIWYPACAIFVVSAVIDSHSTNKKPGKITLFDFFEKLSLLTAIMIFGSAFIINYYNVAFSWWWAGFVIFAVYFPVFMFGIRKYLEKEKSYTPEQIKKSKKNCLKYVLFYWLIDLFYMSIFNYWQATEQLKTPWFILQFVFGGLAMVYIFYNLTRVFLANGEKHWWGLLQDFVLGILTTIYLIFLLPNDSGLQTVAATIIAAVYGGLLTLVGVAWTIKDGNDKQQKEITRIENDRKEEERKRYVPFVNLYTDKCNKPDHTITIPHVNLPCSCKKNYYIIESCFLKNTDFSAFCVSEIIINNYLIHVQPHSYIDKKWIVKIKFKHCFILDERIEYFGIQVKDMLGNVYNIAIDFEPIYYSNGFIKIKSKGCYPAELVKPNSNEKGDKK